MQESFLVLKSLRDIKEDEPLTISHAGMSNLELYFKHGKVLKNNPDNTALVFVKFDHVLHYLDELFEIKQRLFEAMGGLPNLMKLYENRIDSRTLQILRIFFLTNEDLRKNKDIVIYAPFNFETWVSEDNERWVYEFIVESLKDYRIDEKCEVDLVREVLSEEK